jgi:hypothetical protein
MEKPDNGQSADPVFADPGLLNTAGRRWDILTKSETRYNSRIPCKNPENIYIARIV